MRDNTITLLNNIAVANITSISDMPCRVRARLNPGRGRCRPCQDVNHALFIECPSPQVHCFSGGWIIPDGKLPDASRPPVGRTRGGQTHPRPL
ncbi:MAG: hypothetical protein ACQESR_05635 [Planctomycetota bacterium]